MKSLFETYELKSEILREYAKLWVLFDLYFPAEGQK